MNKKREVYFFASIFLVLLLVAVVLSANFVSSQNEATQINTKDTGLWDYLKEKTDAITKPIGTFFSSQVKSFTNGIGWLVGYNTFEGDSMHLFSANYWTTNGWKYALGSFVTGLIILIFITGDLTLGFIDRAYKAEDVKAVYSNLLVIDLPLLILFPIFMGIPILNRFLQLITFELIGLHWFWRCLIFAAILFFGPIFLRKYRRYRKRNYEYKSQLRKIAGEEIEKVHLGSS